VTEVDDERPPLKLHRWEQPSPKLMGAAVALSVGLAIYAVGVADPVAEPAPTTVTVPVPMPTQPIDRLSSDDIEFLRFLLTIIGERALTRQEQQAVDRITGLLDEVDDGEVGLTPDPPQPPPPRPQPPPSTTTTTTTTTTEPDRPILSIPSIDDIIELSEDDYIYPTTVP
jgi:hypothetical protein